MIKIKDLTFEYFDRDEEGNLTEMINAIRGIHFDAKKGEYITVVGKNGSGKSTFAKILNRLLLPIEGTVVIGGLNAMEENNIIPIRKLVGMVFQNPDNQLIGSIVEEDVAFGAENLGVPQKELRGRVDETLKQIGLDGKKRISELSGGEKQKVAIAGILAMKPQCIVLDEATSMLDPKSRQEILDIMLLLKEQGITIIQITHLMEETLLADQIYIMHQGKIVMKGRKEAIFADEKKLLDFGLELPESVRIRNRLIEENILDDISAFSVDDIVKRLRKKYSHCFMMEKNLEPLVKQQGKLEPTKAIMLQNVTLSYGKNKVLTDVSCNISKGEYVSIVGPTGAGKSSMIEMLPGLIKPTSGAVYVDGVEVFDSATDLQKLRTKIGFVFQYPEQQLFGQNVYEDVVFGPRNVGVSEIEAERRAYESISLMGLPQDIYDLPMDKLSGGQRRRVALAGVIAMQPEYLILDEPTAGLDPEGKRELLEIIEALHRNAGITIIMVTHDVESVVRYADRVIALEDGYVVYDGNAKQSFYSLWLNRMAKMEQALSTADIDMETATKMQENFMKTSMCDMPCMTMLLLKLRLAGMEVPCQFDSLEDGIEAIKKLVQR